MPASISYKSFCWSFGTTSFRTKNFNKTIEEQLALLNGFWQLPENQDCIWNGNTVLQTRYYDYMKRMGFVETEANNKPKDAREKTSGLVDIGLVDDGRNLTNAGISLLEVCNANDFSTDNFFEIPKDSYIYLKQLLKTSSSIDGQTVRPFIVLLYVLSRVEELSMEEFTYLLPLCTNYDNTQDVIDAIQQIRANELCIDEYILERLMNMDNYQCALRFLLGNTVDEDVIRIIGMNRKSSKEDGKNYDKDYLPLYNALHRYYISKDVDAIVDIYEATRNIKIGKWWRQLLFDTSSRKAIHKKPCEHLKHSDFDSVRTLDEFKTLFFETMHLFKAKATLWDYRDLNRRYIKTTDVILFEDDVVKLDIVPKHFFNSVIEDLYIQGYENSPELYNDCAINNIAICLNINEQSVIDSVNAELGAEVTTIAEARAVLDDNRYARLQHLIDTKFSDTQLLTLLDCFERRNDTDIRSMVTDNADVSTIFEYVLAILWYKVSERRGRILDYMKLSLDADLLPKTHAAGGEADIVYEYDATEHYPSHTLLIEATLADSTNQRRMEMEPVSRHLGQHLIRTRNMDSYCVFATNFLNINVISDFRSRKNTPYYDSQDYTQYVEGMKIIPLETSELKKIILTNKKYTELYSLFNTAFNSTLPPHQWYDVCIRGLHF